MIEYVICVTCGENLGEHRPFFAEEHLKKYPSHSGFKIISNKVIHQPKV